MTTEDFWRCNAAGEHQIATRHHRDECPTEGNPEVEREVEITVTRSAGDDRAVVIHIDTNFEPDSSDGGPGLRVLINDDEAYVGKAYDFGASHDAEAKSVIVKLSDIPYIILQEN